MTEDPAPSHIETVILQNRNVWKRVGPVQMPLAWYLIRRAPLAASDLRFETRFALSYASISEKHTSPFGKVMRRLDGYLGAGPIGPNKRWEYPWVLANLCVEAGQRVLDAGCGRSPLQFALAHVGCRVSGVDPAEDAAWHGIDRGLARRFGCAIEYRREGIEALSYPEASFDRVLCVSVLEHCRTAPVADEKRTPFSPADRELHRRMIREMLRVLKPGGMLVVTVDYNFPRSDCIPESNIDVGDLLACGEAEVVGPRTGLPLPGGDGFDPARLIEDADVDISNYADTLQTSVGFVLRKR